MSQIILGVGTIKGAFLFTSNESRKNWKMSAPLLPGWEVSAMYIEPKAGGRIYAGTVHYAYGATIRVSDDMVTWRQIDNGPRYAADRGFQTSASGRSRRIQPIRTRCMRGSTKPEFLSPTIGRKLERNQIADRSTQPKKLVPRQWWIVSAHDCDRSEKSQPHVGWHQCSRCVPHNRCG